MIYNFSIYSFKNKDMVEESKGPKRHMAEELTSRFRSKEDLYRYLTQQGKSWLIDGRLL